jgi:biopolymer transport protein ExbD
MRIDRGGRGRGVDVVPLIDTVFLLLVIFLVMVLRMRVDEGLNVELPPVGHGTPAKSPEDRSALVIGVARSGQVVIGGRTIPGDTIHREVRQQLNGAGSRATVEIRGDRQAPHGVVMTVLAAVQGAGVRDIRFQVSPVYAATAIREDGSR